MIDTDREKTRILLVEDETLVAMGISDWLSQAGYVVVDAVPSGEEAIQAAADLAPDLVLMDIRLRGDIDGVTAAEVIKTRFDVPIIYLTAHADETTLQRAKSTAPLGYVSKPVQPQELRSNIEVALYKHQLDRKLRESEARYRVIAELTSDFAYSSRVEQPGNVIVTEWTTDAYESITGYNIEETNWRGGWATLVHPDDLALYQQHLQILLSGRRHTEEYRIINRQAQVCWLRVTSVPVLDALHQNIVRIYGAVEDISQRKQAEETLQQRHRELELLYRAGRAFNSTHDLDQMLAMILQEVRLLLNITGCSAWLLDDDTGELVCRQATEPEAGFVRGLRLAPGQGLAGWVVQNERGLIVPDARKDKRHYKEIDKKTGLALRSIMTVPLRLGTGCQRPNGQTVIGVIQVVDTKVNRFKQNDLRLLESLAGTVAIAVENGWLYEQVQQDVEMKAVLLREINHRTKNNLSAIIGLLAVERRYVKPEDRPAYETIRQNLVGRIQGLAAAHGLLSTSGWTSLRLSELAEQIVTLAFQSPPGDRPAQVEVRPSEVRISPDQAHNLALVINELATNTLKYAGLGEESAVKVTVNVRQAKDMIRLEYKDNGPGYPAGVLALDPGQLGVGFELIQNLVRRNLRGTLFLYNDGGAGASIQFKAEAGVVLEGS